MKNRTLVAVISILTLLIGHFIVSSNSSEHPRINADYNLVYLNKLSPLIVEVGIAVLYYFPAIVIWFVSAAIVAGLDD